MEKKITIITKDKKKIYGRLRGALSKPVVVQVHGLGGNMDEALHYNAARYFEKSGFSSFRFNLYDFEKNARNMQNCTLKTHAADLDTVIVYLRKRGARKIFVVGHSYGAPTILHSIKKDFDCAVFWDGSPCEFVTKYFDGLKYYKALNGRLLEWGIDVVIGESMVKEARKIDSFKLIAHHKTPILFAYAENGEIHTIGKKVYNHYQNEKKFIVIKKADHNFNDGDVQKKLYAETVKWFKKHT